MYVKFVNFYPIRNTLILTVRNSFNKMEYFENAHRVISKHTESNSKCTETFKKQLKQMMYGYKNSNNQIIKDSVNIRADTDDSSSASGVSDLNLTTSGNEDDTGPIRSTDNDFNNTDHKDTIANDGEYKRNINKNPDSDSDLQSYSKSTCSEIISDNTSFLSDTGSLISDTGATSEIFDHNGELAKKINDRLAIASKKQKRKLSRNNEMEHSEICEDSQLIIQNNKNLRSSHVGYSKESGKCSKLPQNSKCKSNINKSPEFISITADNMHCESFDDILAGYNHSVTKNVPSNHQSVDEDMWGLWFDKTKKEDIHQDGEVSSLVPELDDDVSVDDIESSDTVQDDTGTLTEDNLQTQNADLPIDNRNNNNKQFDIYYMKNSCVIVLKHPTEIYVQGKVKIRKLAGRVELFGYTLTETMNNVYAPYYSYCHSIKTVAYDNNYFGLMNKLTNAGLAIHDAESIVTTITPNTSVMLLKKFDSKKFNFLDNNFKLSNLFVKPFKHMNDEYLTKASDILGCSIFPIRPFKYFQEDPIWTQAEQLAFKERSIGIVCGGKGVGKSTYLRYQVNKLLGKGPVLVIDLDPGQSEFTVAGNVSATVVREPLLGPNYTHLKKPNMMLNIGMINVMDNVNLYVKAMQRLLFYCYNTDTYKNMPWIINTMGMTNSHGMKLMALIIIHSRPTYVMQYNSKQQKRRFDMYLNMESIKWFYEDNKRDRLFNRVVFPEDLDYAFILLEETIRQGKSSYYLTPKDERLLNFLGYFSDLVDVYRTENILSITPYEIHLKDITICANIRISRGSVLDVINGKIVGLCSNTTQCDTSKVFTLSDKPLVCHGHGLVRGADWRKETLYIITPVPYEQLKSVNILMYSDWTPDMGNFVKYLPNGTVVPYSTMACDQHRNLMQSPRRRFNPLQLIKEGVLN